jgi:lipopolysaccharide transport system ATP-binding protein
MEPIISVRGLGKSYRIQTGERKPYRTLRDDIADFGKGLLKGQWGNSKTEEFWALKDIDFDIYPGEVVGIIGRNGAGKSTLLKVLSRVVQPTKGEAILKGRVASLLEVGTGFHPELTGRENIFMSGAVLGMKRSEIKDKFDEIVAFAEIERFLDTPVKRYSSGMYVRLAFAVASHLEAEILLVDEVLAVGDANFQAKCIGKLEEAVQKSARTVIFVSHQLTIVRDLCNNVVWLDKGSIYATGQSREIISSYISEIVSKPSQSVIQGSQYSIISAQVLNRKYECVSILEASQPWYIRVCYELEESTATGVSLRIKNSQGIIVFDLHECVGGADKRSAGRYLTTFNLTQSSLAPGHYTFSIYLMIHQGIQHLSAEHYSSFTVEGSLVAYKGTKVAFDIEGVIYVEPIIKTEKY